MGVIAPKLRHILLVGVANLGLVATVAAAQAAPRDTSFRIEAQPLATALRDLAMQSGVSILADSALTQGKRAPRYTATSDVEVALGALLRGSGLTYRQRGSLYVVVAARATTSNTQDEVPPQTAENDGEVLVTAQKIEESIQDVPIAVSAFSGAALDNLKIETGGELLRAIPNVTFSKSNFSGYNFSIRGVGTKAVSASTDPAVAVSFNNTPLIRNRLFEQEFLDLQRVEVLRGPQGTLYGRNATGGVVNVLPALPSNKFSAEIEAEVGNYETRRVSGMVNLPLGPTLAVRAAGAYTKRDGFEYNSFNDTRVNGRDLWSTRVSALWEPSADFRASMIWQHFEEDDNRSRSGKQLCTRDPGPTRIGSTPVPETLRARFSQGCVARTLFSDDAFGVPNAESFPHVLIAGLITIGSRPDFTDITLVPQYTDPYEGITQSRNLREISTSYDPVFRAKNDFYQLNLDVGLGDGLQLISQTAYARDRYYSSQDYSRFASNPIFANSTAPGLDYQGFQVVAPNVTPGGVYTDPQLGPSNRFLSVDLSKSSNEQWTQELRLQSSWDGPLNINLGGNYLNFKSKDDYYVFSNLFTVIGEYFYNSLPLADRFDFDNSIYRVGTRPCKPTSPTDANADCIYIDPNPIDKINGEGHNYFRSKNEVQTKSWALFGELYYKITDRLKLTGGLRYTNDTKTSTPYPSQLLLGIGEAMGITTGGKAAIGYPAQPDIVQKWQRFSGRAVIDWKPDLGFTRDTLVYGSFSHGYKGGGSNPPRVDFDPTIVRYQPLAETFAPEYVNAFEIGTKNVFANGKAGLNLTGFYYDYTNYQVSQIVDRISLNENFDSTSMGLEAEAWWQPSRSFRIDANLGYLRTRIADGEQSIDVMDRTQGNPDWVVVRPWVQVPSNCIAPRVAVEAVLTSPLSLDPGMATTALAALCSASNRYGDYEPNLPNGLLPLYAMYGFLFDPLLPYDPTKSPTQPFGSTAPRSGAPNGGRGFYADLGGNELPNSPRLTLNVGAQYSLFLDEWKLTLRGDYYRQGPSYARVYNTAYDRLRGWNNANLAFTLENAKWDMTAQFYVKNVFNNTPITDAFTNSDDTGLTTNVFTLEPRIFGFRLAKRF